MKVGDYVTFRSASSLNVQLAGIKKARVVRVGTDCGYQNSYHRDTSRNNTHVPSRVAVVCVEGYGSASNYTASDSWNNYAHQPTKIGPGVEFIVSIAACEVTTEHDVEPQFRTNSTGGYDFRSPAKDVLDFLLAAG